MINVKGKWALITGASRGLGSKVALFMAQEGCHLILHSRELEHTEKIATQIEAYGVKTHRVAGELSDESAVLKLIEDIDALGEDISFIFNNAGMQVAYRPDFYLTPASDYTKSFMINTIAPMMVCYHFVPKMIEKGFGRIINTTSDIDKEPEQAGYSASKAALEKVTRDLETKTREHDVLLSLVNPSWCRTDLGGSYAPNDPDSALPGLVLPAFIEGSLEGKVLNAQDFKDMSLEEAYEKLTRSMR